MILTTGAIAWVALLIVSLISIIVKVPLEEKLMLETLVTNTEGTRHGSNRSGATAISKSESERRNWCTLIGSGDEMKTLWLRKAENVDHQLRMIQRMLLSSFDTDKSSADTTLPRQESWSFWRLLFRMGSMG